MIVLLIKGKLFQTENYMPFFSALVKHTKKKILIIYPTKYDFNIIKQNKDIFNALNALGKIKYFYSIKDFNRRVYKKKSGIWYICLGLLSVLHRYLVLIPLLFKKAIIFGNDRLQYIEWILNFNKKILKGKRISLLIYPYDLKMFENEIRRVLSVKKDFMPFKKVIEYNSDVLISSYSSKEIKKLSPDIYRKYKIFNIGYNLYNWPTWARSLENASSSDINFLKKTEYIFFPLATIEREMLTKNGNLKVNFTNTILFLIKSISKINKNILIIFRPHPTSKLNDIKPIIEMSKHKKYLISYTNSLILIKYSKFIIKYGISLMDPKVIYYNKICLRYHPRSILSAIKEEFKNSKHNKKLNIFDITKKNTLEKIVIKLLLKKEKKYQKKKALINEKKILQNFINYLEE